MPKSNTLARTVNAPATEPAAPAGAQAARDHSSPVADALSRFQAILANAQDYPPITCARASEIADELIGQDEDEDAFAFIELLRGLAAAHFNERRDQAASRGPGVEDLVHAATTRAYARTMHCDYSLNEFAALDPQNPRDRRVLRREWHDAEPSPPGAAEPEADAEEPPDRTSAKWRAWKVRQVTRAFEWREGDHDAYQRAWDEYRALLMGLVADENFWHVSFAARLLPHLLAARQEIADLV